MSDFHGNDNVEATKDSGNVEDASASPKDEKYCARTFTAESAVQTTMPVYLNWTQCEDNSNKPSIHKLRSADDVVSFPSTSNEAIRLENNPPDEADNERSCWICLANEKENPLAAWVHPCKCRGTTKWVHERCLYRWIEEKQKGNPLRTVKCHQCRTEYTIVFAQMGKVAYILDAFENIKMRACPYLSAGIFIGSVYWTAVTFGAITVLQVVGHKKGLALMELRSPILLLIGLPVIPVSLVLCRLIPWEDTISNLIRNRRSVAREDEAQSAQNSATPVLSEPVSATKTVCGALLLPTISSIVGRLLFGSIESTTRRTLLGGLTFITIKGILKIYLKQHQYTLQKKRRIADYTESN